VQKRVCFHNLSSKNLRGLWIWSFTNYITTKYEPIINHFHNHEIKDSEFYEGHQKLTL
jgi:hypothetical protein